MSWTMTWCASLCTNAAMQNTGWDRNSGHWQIQSLEWLTGEMVVERCFVSLVYESFCDPSHGVAVMRLTVTADVDVVRVNFCTQFIRVPSNIKVHNSTQHYRVITANIRVHFYRAIVATVPGEKLLTGCHPLRNWTQIQLFSLFYCELRAIFFTDVIDVMICSLFCVENYKPNRQQTWMMGCLMLWSLLFFKNIENIWRSFTHWSFRCQLSQVPQCCTFINTSTTHPYINTHP